jgi:lysophospholipase L1-like esterase
MERAVTLRRLICGNLLVLIALILVTDLGARLVIGGRRYTLFEDPNLYVGGDRPFIVEHPTRGFSLQPGYRSPTITINDAGFRAGQSEDPRAVAIVLTLGDSTTFGWGVRDDETYPHYLEEILNASRTQKLRVINAGVPSYTSLQALIYLRELLPRIRPDVVVINEMWNDIWYSSIKNWFPEMLIWRRPKAWRTFLLKYSAVYRAIALGADDEAHEVDVFNEKALQYHVENVGLMLDECEKAGVAVLIAYPPFEPEHLQDRWPRAGQRRFSRDFIANLHDRYSAALESLAKQRGITPIAHDLMGSPKPYPSLFIDFMHPTASGNRRMAQAIAAAVEGQKVLDRK